MDTLCPFCLQRNPHPNHIKEHLENPAPLQKQNAMLIAKHMQFERQNTTTTIYSGTDKAPQ